MKTFFDVDTISSFIDSSKCAYATDDCLLFRTLSQNRKNKSTASFVSVRGWKMQSLINQMTLAGRGCNFELCGITKNTVHWEHLFVQIRHCCVFQPLVELEVSDAPFNDSIMSYIYHVEQGFQSLFVTGHRRALVIDGSKKLRNAPVSNVTQPIQIVASAAQEANNYSSQPSLFHDNAFLDTSFL